MRELERLAKRYEADAQELACIREVARAAEARTVNKCFFYNEAQSRFDRNESSSSSQSKLRFRTLRAKFIAAGSDIQSSRRARREDTDVRFKVVVAGRTARFLNAKDSGRNVDRYNRNKNLSYE